MDLDTLTGANSVHSDPMVATGGHASGSEKLLVEHDMEFIRRLDCRVGVLHAGAVLAEGSRDHVTANRQVIDVYLGR